MLPPLLFCYKMTKEDGLTGRACFSCLKQHISILINVEGDILINGPWQILNFNIILINAPKKILINGLGSTILINSAR